MTTIIIHFFIICVPSQQLQGQLQKQCSVNTGNYIKTKAYMLTGRSNTHMCTHAHTHEIQYYCFYLGLENAKTLRT
jgi:hypothetical protein